MQESWFLRTIYGVISSKVILLKTKSKVQFYNVATQPMRKRIILSGTFQKDFVKEKIAITSYKENIKFWLAKSNKNYLVV